MDTYPAEIDEQLEQFSRTHGLHLSTRYRDEAVLSFQIVDDQSGSFQLWLEQTQGGWKVRAWDYRSRRSEHSAEAGDLRGALEAAYEDVLEWIRDLGHTRVPE